MDIFVNNVDKNGDISDVMSIHPESICPRCHVSRNQMIKRPRFLVRD